MTKFCPYCGRIVRYDPYHKCYYCIQYDWQGDFIEGQPVDRFPEKVIPT